MDITVYLPDEIGKWAKGAKLNLSALLRQAVVAEQRRHAALQALGGKVEEFEFDLATPSGDVYTGVLRGRALTEEHDGRRYYLTPDGRVKVHLVEQSKLVDVVSAGEPGLYASVDDYVAVCAALGEDARIEV